jgi:hypothetical protein
VVDDPTTVPEQWQHGHSSTAGVSAMHSRATGSVQAPCAPEAGETRSASDLGKPAQPRDLRPDNGAGMKERGHIDTHAVSMPGGADAAGASQAQPVEEARRARFNAVVRAHSPGAAYDGAGGLPEAARVGHGAACSAGQEQGGQQQALRHGGGSGGGANAAEEARRGPDTTAHTAEESGTHLGATRRRAAGATADGLAAAVARRRERAAGRRAVPGEHSVRTPTQRAPPSPSDGLLPTHCRHQRRPTATGGRVRHQR